MTATYIVYLIRHLMLTLRLAQRMINRTNRSIGYIIDVRKVPNHIAIVENFDGFIVFERRSKQHRTHIRSSPRTIYCEVPKTDCLDSVQFTITMRHQFVTLFGCRIQTYW